MSESWSERDWLGFLMGYQGTTYECTKMRVICVSVQGNVAFMDLRFLCSCWLLFFSSPEDSIRKQLAQFTKVDTTRRDDSCKDRAITQF